MSLRSGSCVERGKRGSDIGAIVYLPLAGFEADWRPGLENIDEACREAGEGLRAPPPPYDRDPGAGPLPKL